MSKEERYERVFPLLAGAVATLAVVGFAWLGPFEAAPWRKPGEFLIGPLFSLTVGVGAIAIGFLGTAKGILLSIQGTKVGKQIQANGLMVRLSAAASRAVSYSFFLVAVSIAGVVIESALKVDWLWKVAMPIWVFALVSVGASAHQVTSVLFVVLKRVAEPPARKTEGDSAL